MSGTLTQNRPLSDLTWLRVGGPAELFYQPSDRSDLAAFLSGLDLQTPVFPMGVGSNLIVRDGGLPGAVIRMGGLQWHRNRRQSRAGRGSRT